MPSDKWCLAGCGEAVAHSAPPGDLQWLFGGQTSLLTGRGVHICGRRLGLLSLPLPVPLMLREGEGEGEGEREHGHPSSGGGGCPFVRPVLSCPVLSCPVLSCPVLSCPVLSCPVLSSPARHLAGALGSRSGVRGLRCSARGNGRTGQDRTGFKIRACARCFTESPHRRQLLDEASPLPSAKPNSD
jgi:hypothetical protein